MDENDEMWVEIRKKNIEVVYKNVKKNLKKLIE
jgi:hypothetical protein